MLVKIVDRFSVQPGWKILIRDMGINPADVLTLAHLPTDLFARIDATLSTTEYFNLWNALEELESSKELPLRIGQAISVEAFDPPLFASLCSPNLNCALQRLSEFKKLICPLRLWVNITEQYTQVTVDCYGYDGLIPRSLGATELVFFTALARLATRHNIVPLDVIMVELPKNIKPYQEYFQCTLHKGKANQIIFSAENAVHPFLTENTAMWNFFNESLKKRLSDLKINTSIVQRVRSALLEMLPVGQSSIDDLAKKLAMSKRTLQRYLNDEFSSYQSILNEIRQELAQHYLVNSNISPAEISWLLGFKDSNSFIRAFKSWTNLTPGMYRQNNNFQIHH
ncbi:MAG: AraC family transcriptional regulator ligand-binding domain-containing protein [Pseudomonadota bacterium]